ncbi:phage tail protein [Chromobacterium haemolyticum]|uniref:phage tail protein n=1 Tax=Chromobacterium haemolyticum TaxID=394935 RepID=UPI000DF00576|nr:phage tail protein [Chromobacterium haemolyticum]
MGGMFGGGGTKISTSAPVVSSLRMQTSAYGRAIPLIYGKSRVASNVIWYGDFISIERRSTQSAGGKGGGGGGTTVESISYTYQVALQLGLCEGPVRSVTNAWVGKKVGSIDHWNLSQFNGSYSQQPMGYVQSRHPDQALAYRGTAYVGTGVFELGEDPTLPNMTFEIDSSFGFSNDIRDANPRDVVLDFSTNPYYGAGVPASKFGDLKPFSDFCVANGLFISPAYTEQEPAHEILARLFRLTNSGVYFSEGKIKVVPYSDTAATGNGVTFTPNMTPVYDLTDDDFLASGSEDPILCTRVAASDAHNSVRVKFFNRGNSYNEEVAEAKDQASIEQFGLRTLEVELHEVADAGVARLVAQQILQRSLYVRNSYEFRLGWKYALLEPTDLVTLTDAALGLDKTPVRIAEIEEDEDGELLVRAEEVPLGSVGATRYPTQNGDGYSSNYNMPAGPVSQPVIFEPPLSLAGAPQIWIATSGGKNWGGCDVWVSDDNATYLRIGRIVGRSRHGVLASKLDNGPGVDTVNNLRVDLSVSGGALLAATQQNAEELVTLCYVDGELLAYRDATLTAPNQYDLGYLVRGAHGTVISSHAAGSKFARLDQALAKFPYDKAKVGKTVYIKLQSFNIHGGGVEDLSTLTPVTYQITGAPLADVTGLALEQPFIGRSCKIKWNPVDGAANYTVEVWAGTPQTLRRSASVGDARRFEYSWEDGKADGGPWRQLVFRVRATSQTGASGNWATLVASNPVPAVLTGVSVNPGFKSAFFSCNQPADTDITGIRIWMSATSGFSPADDCLVYDGPDFFTTLYKLWSGAELAAGTTYYVKAAAYDSFGKDGLNISSEVAVTPVSVAGGIKPGEIEAEMIKAIDASKVVGTLKDWQIDAINALKVTGQLSDAQVAGLSVEKLVGQVKLAQLAGDVQGPLNSAVSTANQALVKANESASATTVQKLQAAVGQRRRMLLRSCGFNDPQRDSGLWVDDAKVLGGGLGYTLATINEAGNVVASARFDFQSDESAQAAANWLNAVPTGTAVFVYTDEDAWARRLKSGFPEALYRVGASKAIFGNPAFKFRSAYLLVGRAGVGEGSGFEMYAGQAYADPAARVELKFDWLNGSPMGLGNNALGSLLQKNVDSALTRVGWVEAALNDKAAAGDLTALQSTVAGNKATADQQLATLADADKALGQSINQVNARLAPGGDINGAIVGKAAQAELDAAVQRIATAETTLAGKASASDVSRLQASVSRNLLDTSAWKPGAAFPVGKFVPNENTLNENALILGDGPFGEKLTVWKGTAKGGDADGGWNYSNIPVDETQRYRLTVWMRPVAKNGQMYFGTGNVFDIGGGGNPNPYFASIPKSSFVYGRWYLWVGYIFPSSYTGPQLSKSGVYDGTTGAKVADGTDFRFYPGGNTVVHRAYQYYSEEGAEQWFALPRFEVCDGNEPTLSELLSGAALFSANAAISRISTVESTVAGKANAQDVTTLAARVGTAEASVTQVQQAQATLDGKVASKWGVVLGAAQSDGRQKLAGIQAFNDGSVSQFVITADQLLISSGESLIPDPNYYQLDWWGRPGNPIEEASEAGWARSRRRLMMANGIATESISKQFVLEPGAAYRLEVEVYGNAGSGGIGVDLHVPGVWWWSFSGSGDGKWLTESQSGARTFATTVTIPRSISFNWGQIRIRHAITSGSYIVGLISVTRVSGTTLIADGAITTDKVAANAVTADKIAANQITATHIVVGSLTGDRLAANSITGDKVQAGAITANHIDSRGLTIKDTAGNIIFGAGQNLDVNRVAGLGSLARKSQVAASDMAVGQLSAITANIGEVTAGIMYSNDRQKYFNLDPSRSPAMMHVPGAVQINFDGSGYFARTIVSAPDVRASGVAWVNSGWLGSSGTWTTFIDTGVNLPSGWSSSSSDMFQASATIAGGNSQSGGAMGYTSVEVVHGDGLLAGAANSPIDNRMYIKFTWNGAGTSGGVINITRIDWKLVRV